MASKWQSTALRIKNPGDTIPFYEKHFGMRLLCQEMKDDSIWDRYFLTRPRVSQQHQSHEGNDDALLEFWHQRGVEDDPAVHYDSGNNEPKRGFGHIAFAVDDVYATSASLESTGVNFLKRPDEGRMKGLAFCLDPDGYWIELVKRSENVRFPEPFNLAQTMLRVKDPRKSLDFYCEVLGALLGVERHFKDFRHAWVKSLWCPILELTHNHNTELVDGPVYHNGNTNPLGFRHLSFRLKEGKQTSAELLAELERQGGGRVDEDCGTHHSTFTDPDGYWVRVYNS